MDIKWYVVYTKPGLEKKVSDILTRKRIENYIPASKASGNWRDTKKVKEAPLFKGYVFAKTTKLQLPELKKINGVVNLVYWMGEPVCIKNIEIKAIKHFLSKYKNVSVEKTAINSDTINTATASQSEQEVTMISIKNKIASITLPSLGYMMTAEAEIEIANVRIISSENVLDIENLKSNKLFDKVSEFNNSLKNYWAKS